MSTVSILSGIYCEKNELMKQLFFWLLDRVTKL